jgi:hypothetical protein
VFQASPALFLLKQITKAVNLQKSTDHLFFVTTQEQIQYQNSVEKRPLSAIFS